jgi:hypothetical protein
LAAAGIHLTPIAWNCVQRPPKYRAAKIAAFTIQSTNIAAQVPIIPMPSKMPNTHERAILQKIIESMLTTMGNFAPPAARKVTGRV